MEVPFADDSLRFSQRIALTSQNALEQIVIAQILQENQGLRRIAQELLKVEIPKMVNNLCIDDFKGDQTTNIKSFWHMFLTIVG